MGEQNSMYEPMRTRIQPIMADPTRRQWARLAHIEMERRRYESRAVITADTITNLKITLALATTVQDVIDNG